MTVAVDVLIRGAGPVGCAAALALRNGGKKVLVRAEGSHAGPFRPIVLSYASRLILERLGAWPGFAVTPIETIGADGDALEAQAFAFMAVRSVRGLPISFPTTTGAPEPLCGGVLVHPASAI